MTKESARIMTYLSHDWKRKLEQLALDSSKPGKKVKVNDLMLEAIVSLLKKKGALG